MTLNKIASAMENAGDATFDYKAKYTASDRNQAFNIAKRRGSRWAFIYSREWPV